MTNFFIRIPRRTTSLGSVTFLEARRSLSMHSEPVCSCLVYLILVSGLQGPSLPSLGIFSASQATYFSLALR